MAEALAAKIKALEAKWDLSLSPRHPFLVRLDGVAFKTFTKSLKKPFDTRLTIAMIKTAAELLRKSGARLAYTQSDEITLVFAKQQQTKKLKSNLSKEDDDTVDDLLQQQMYYGGRAQKIASVLAGMASAFFNFHFAEISPPACVAFFDGRVCSVENEWEACRAVWWRHGLDGRRNAINQIAHAHFDHHKLQGLPQHVLVRMLREQVPGHDKAFHIIYGAAAFCGTFLKKLDVPSIGFNPLTKEHVQCTRSIVQGRSFIAEELTGDVVTVDGHGIPFYMSPDVFFAEKWLPEHYAGDIVWEESKLNVSQANQKTKNVLR